MVGGTAGRGLKGGVCVGGEGRVVNERKVCLREEGNERRFLLGTWGKVKERSRVRAPSHLRIIR